MIRKITKTEKHGLQILEYSLCAVAMTTTVILVVLNSIDKLKKGLMEYLKINFTLNISIYG